MTRDPASSQLHRPVLAPGLRVVARVAGELEIGLTPAHRLRLADTPSVRRVLDALDRGEAPRDSPSTRRALAALAPVLRDGDCLVDPALAPGEVAAAVLRHPHGAAQRLHRRTQHRVLLAGDADLVDALGAGALIRRTGLGVSDPAARAAPTVVLVLAHGEPARSDLDPLLRRGIPHLLLRLVESDAVLGPFVVPGTTACLRCLDAHDAATDAGRLRRLAGYAATERNDGVAEPVDSAVATTALGWAVADLVRFAEGDRPTTWSATIGFASGRSSAQAVTRLRHPACGCSWATGEHPAGPAGPSVTMGA
jgi:bacteriocin biosynthesis cyclodehydratase domain-containing protein